MIQEYETMNIYSKPGHQVKVTKRSSRNGHALDKTKIQKFLEIGEHYTVNKIEVDNWFSIIVLAEFPNVEFNTVCFEDVNKAINSKK